MGIAIAFIIGAVAGAVGMYFLIRNNPGIITK